MSDQTSPKAEVADQSHRREPLYALSLSLVCPGAGHIYCGRIVAGLIIFLASLSLPSAVAIAAVLSTSLGTTLLISATFGFLVLYIYAAFDAFRAARHAHSDYQLQVFNRGIVYLTLAIVGCASPIVSTALLRASVFEAFYIPTNSMNPTLVSGDRIVVNKVYSRGELPQRGQIIVFRNPENRKQMYVKRVVGLPGDKIEHRGHEVYLNGNVLPRERLPKESLAIPTQNLPGELFEEQNGGHRYRVLVEDGKPATKSTFDVPPGNCYVLGDNRQRSKDSRHFSFVPLGDIEGRVQAVVLPAHSWRRFGTAR